ncbi:basic membrane lipoprotein [Gracilibacillus halophilus YIM-C55.5]|uniref:Basic membrane lipoprotein n=1 Tax=Gracilibacillus halophilus YIM-C55.5 TaxID=1308866 RepID=N4WAT9_9BACI|nr:BMP family ABC transporter substrate-binding protein [Gracilibacillus halophilus]ENH97408.1 basic membrane lipoprotein [Gracilibacillus halophilus YIM-C55.5]
MRNNQQLKTILTITVICSIIVIVALIWKSSVILTSMNSTEDRDTHVAVFTTDVTTDQSWGSLAYKGTLLMKEQFDVTTNLYSEVDLENDLHNQITTSIQNGTDIIIGHGREFSEPFQRLSNEFPETQFITVHGDYYNSNLAVYTFDQQEIEYVAGVAAALKTETNKVGLIDVENKLHKNWGFPTGLKEMNPDIKLLYEVVHTRNNSDRAVRLAKKLIEQGADIIYSKGNGYNKAVMNYAKEHDVYLIGYLEDQSYMAENKMLTSVVNNVEQVYVSILEDYFSEDGIPSDKIYLDSEDGVYGLAPLGDMFSQSERDTIQEKKEEMLTQNDS